MQSVLPVAAAAAAAAAVTDASGAAAGAFDTQDWYNQLFEFGLAGSGNGGADGATTHPGDDPDADLVPRLVESLVLPAALHAVQRCALMMVVMVVMVMMR